MPEGKVLIVDDAPEIRRLLGRLCTREGYEVILAPDGETALQHIASQPFDVAIVDLVLPGMDGLEVLRRIREQSPSTDVIILTGYGELETAAKTLAMGASHYFQKEPFNLNLIPLVIGRILERQRLSRENEQLIRELQTANLELERGRQRQLRSLEHISHALGGNLSIEDMASVLGQAILSVIDCDATGILVTDKELTEAPFMSIVSAHKLPPSLERNLVDLVVSLAQRPLELPPRILETYIEDTPIAGASQEWAAWHTEILNAHDAVLGALIVARTKAQPFTAEELEMLRILCAQGSTALENVYLFARMRDLATQDSLTGLYNHRHFYELLEAEIARSIRQKHPLAVLMIDIDQGANRGLKVVNDRYGHQAGDTLLRMVAERLRRAIRRSDSLARYGGDEFIVLAPETNVEQAMALAKRLWQRIREEPYPIGEDHVYLTASIGVTASVPSENDTPDTFIQRADQACYQAKESGRDRICVVTPSPTP